eukprot:7196817-Prymnesium_polylepis.1
MLDLTPSLQYNAIAALSPLGNSRLGADGLPQICRVEKPMYGMAQAGRRWQRSIFTWFVSQGFKASHND